jgi:thiamine-phosphate pyrophosphorylase
MEMKIRNGVYLIADPSMERDLLLSRLRELSATEICAVQIWENFREGEDVVDVCAEILGCFKGSGIPVLINNRPELCEVLDFDGVHFDFPPENLSEIREQLGAQRILGVTCNNDISIIEWAAASGIDYLSFCSMFASDTANSCELVRPETVIRAREITAMPIFLAGGIRQDNVSQLSSLPYSGIAVVSGIMHSENPALAIQEYTEQIRRKT